MNLRPQHRQPSRRRDDRQGAVLVEFAIVAPIFFLIVLALFEFSWLNVVRHTADNAVYEASRIAMVPGATAAEATAEANRIMNIVGTRGAAVTVNPAVLNNAATSVTVSVVIPVDQNALVIPAFTGGRQIRATSTLRTERVETR